MCSSVTLTCEHSFRLLLSQHLWVGFRLPPVSCRCNRCWMLIAVMCNSCLGFFLRPGCTVMQSVLNVSLRKLLLRFGFPVLYCVIRPMSSGLDERMCINCDNFCGLIVMRNASTLSVVRGRRTLCCVTGQLDEPQICVHPLPPVHWTYPSAPHQCVQCPLVSVDLVVSVIRIHS